MPRLAGENAPALTLVVVVLPAADAVGFFLDGVTGGADAALVENEVDDEDEAVGLEDELLPDF